jgi:hypothetical protein
VTRINLDGKMLFFTLQIKAKVTSMKKNCFSKSLERHVLTVYDVDLAWNLTIKEKGNCLRVHWWMSVPSFKSLSKCFFALSLFLKRDTILIALIHKTTPLTKL